MNVEQITLPEYTLSDQERAGLLNSARNLRTVAKGRIDESGWVAAARAEWEELPSSLRRLIRGFRRDSGHTGTLLLRGLPVAADALSSTPAIEGSIERAATVSAAALVLVACGLGDPGAFQAEKSGALVQNIVPVPGREEFQGNLGSVELALHNENAFHSHRPDHVALLCLRADHDGMAGLRTACVRAVLPQLAADVRETLFRAEFITEPPPSFGSAAGLSGQRHPILCGALEDPDIRVDFSATRPLSVAAEKSFAELGAALAGAANTAVLAPGDLVIVDNRVALHGRTAFRPRYDGQDRWLQRCFVFTNLRRSRLYRAQDGYVLR